VGQATSAAPTFLMNHRQ